MNRELAYRVIDYIEKNPRKVDLGVWGKVGSFLGFRWFRGGCIAGIATFLHTEGRNKHPDLHSGQEALGLSNDEALCIFTGNTFIRDYAELAVESWATRGHHEEHAKVAVKYLRVALDRDERHRAMVAGRGQSTAAPVQHTAFPVNFDASEVEHHCVIES